MIQRIQSLFLLLVVLTGAALFFLPLATITDNNLYYFKFFITNLKNMSPGQEALFSPYLFMFTAILNISIMAIAFWAFFAFKDRKQQIKLIQIGLLVNIFEVLVIFGYTNYVFEKKYNFITQFDELGIYMPLISLVMFYLAMRYIKKDEAKVRAADRLR
jgi:hypothetical protein